MRSQFRFWFAFLERGIPLIERGRGDVALSRIERSWTTWRGRAIEPLVRESLMRLLPDERWPDTEVVGGMARSSMRAVPGTDHDTRLVAVSRSGVAETLPPAMYWGPQDLVRAWE
ncbi:hypothetical protein [Nocardia beijingensis]|uniref:Uncharacterized protein n=1 Tax=Nocardia beijingensis TaxID=95162 RepID=A0ABW7WJ66_9NOCA